MPLTLSHTFGNHHFKGKTSFSTGLFINDEFVDGSDNHGKVTCKDCGRYSQGCRYRGGCGTAYDTVWGLNTPGFERGKLLIRLAELFEEHLDEIAAIESLDNGKIFPHTKGLTESAGTLRYYGGLGRQEPWQGYGG